jgi:hypothetical protein
MHPRPHLTTQEARIVAGLGGQPWTIDRFSAADLAEARAVWSDVRQAIGFRAQHNGWMTTDTTSPKMRKTGLPSAGVNLHAEKNAASAWRALDPAEQASIAGVFGCTSADVAAALAPTMCAHSTPGCRAACVVAHSANAVLPRSQRARLARTLLTLLAPQHAMTLSTHALEALACKHGRNGARWRVNVSDELRLELLAPALFDVGPLGYAYTKWDPVARPERDGLRIVYSATERWSPDKVAELCGAGHRVAVVLDVAKKAPLPKRWAGVRVVDGDVTDDLWAHPPGVIVGLRAKARTTELKDHMRTSGFAWPATVATPVALSPRWEVAA